MFNHYNRVRANLLTTEAEEDSDWSDTPEDDGSSGHEFLWMVGVTEIRFPQAFRPPE